MPRKTNTTILYGSCLRYIEIRKFIMNTLNGLDEKRLRLKHKNQNPRQPQPPGILDWGFYFL